MNKLFAIILSIVLLSPMYALATDSVVDVDTQPVVNTIDDDVTAEENKVDYKEPMAVKKIAKKFLVAMGAVAGSSLLIFFGLTAYNRVRDNVLSALSNQNGETSLVAPENYEDAVRTFMDKTNW